MKLVVVVKIIAVDCTTEPGAKLKDLLSEPQVLKLSVLRVP